MLVHPTYDPAAKVWFTDDGTEAPSLAVLLGRLPPGSVIQDYYDRAPLVVRREAPTAMSALRTRLGQVKPPGRVAKERLALAVSPPVVPADGRGKQLVFGHDVMLDAWCLLGGDEKKTLAKIGCSYATLKTALANARRRGDERAVPKLRRGRTVSGITRGPSLSKVKWNDERIRYLIQAVGRGENCSQIAAALGGVTRMAVIGKAARLGLRLNGQGVGSRPRPRRWTADDDGEA